MKHLKYSPIKIKCLTVFLITVVCLLCGTVNVSAAPHRTYTYNAWNEEISAPLGYTADTVLNGVKLGVGALKNPTDLYVAKDGDIYISDTDNNRIIVLDSELRFKRIIGEITENGTKTSLQKPGALFVDTNKDIFVTQRDLGRVLRISDNGNVLAVYGKPDSALLDKSFEFLPIKVIKSSNDSVYILSENYFYGAFTYNRKGEFVGFYGSNKVDVTVQVLADYAWKKISTKEQKDKMARYVPIAYVSFDIDDDNFVYTCTQITKDSHDEIRKLNAAGNDIINFYNKNLSSAIGNFGDLKTSWLMGKSTDTQFIDVCADKNKIINCLDYARGRVFQYDEEGHLLNIFGGSDTTRGSFASAAAIDTLEDKILVLDKESASLTVFYPTEYTNTLLKAVDLYRSGLYKEAMPYWEELIGQNINCEIAYIGLGRALYAEKDYKAAMDSFKKGYDRSGYSLAFQAQRKLNIRAAFPKVATGIVIIAVVLSAYILIRLLWLKKPFIKKEKKLTPVRRIFRAMTHPFDEFYDLKDTKQWCLPASIVILLLWFVAEIGTKTLTGFIFNYNQPSDTNILYCFASTVLVYLLFVVINWAVTTLTDGKGSIYEIFVSCTYALIPYIISIFINIIFSNIFTADEAVFYGFVQTLGLLWSLFLLFGALRSVHDFSFTKTAVCLILTAAGMAFVLFLLVLFFTLLQQLFTFGASIVTELFYRG